MEGFDMRREIHVPNALMDKEMFSRVEFVDAFQKENPGQSDE